MSWLTGQHKCHIQGMENVTLTPKKETRLQVLNSLMAEAHDPGTGSDADGCQATPHQAHPGSLSGEGRCRRCPRLSGPQGPQRDARARCNCCGSSGSHQGTQGANHTHLSELLSEREGIDIGRSTLRRILVTAGLSSPRQRRPPKHRVRRQRVPREGMLIQMDGSHHPWLGNQVPPFTLLIAVDDATGTVVEALFCQQEDAPQLLPADAIPDRALRHTRCPVHRPARGIQATHPAPASLGCPPSSAGLWMSWRIQMIFALSPQGKGRVERAAGTFQDRLVTELWLAEASSIGGSQPGAEAVPPAIQPSLRGSTAIPRACISASGPGNCAWNRSCASSTAGKVARDNTVRFQLHTLQLLPGPERPSYAGAAVEVLESLDGRLSVRHEGRIVPAQEAPPSPVFLRNRHEPSAPVPVPPSGAHGLDKRWTATLEPLDSRAEEEKIQGAITDSAATAGKPKAVSPRKPTFLQRERWKAIQKARRKGMSLRAIERELGIHRGTVRKYLDSMGPPPRQPRAGATTSAYDTMAP